MFRQVNKKFFTVKTMKIVVDDTEIDVKLAGYAKKRGR